MHLKITIIQVKEIRNTMFHSADYKVNDADMKADIEAMTTMLEDPKELKQYSQAKSAVTELRQVIA